MSEKQSNGWSGKVIDKIRAWGQKLQGDKNFPHREKLHQGFFVSISSMRLFLEVTGVTQGRNPEELSFEEFRMTLAHLAESDKLPLVRDLKRMHKERKAALDKLVQDEPVPAPEPTIPEPEKKPEGETAVSKAAKPDKPQRQFGWLHLWHPQAIIVGKNRQPFGYVKIEGQKYGPDFYREALSESLKKIFEEKLKTASPDSSGRISLDKIPVSFTLDEAGRNARNIRHAPRFGTVLVPVTPSPSADLARPIPPASPVSSPAPASSVQPVPAVPVHAPQDTVTTDLLKRLSELERQVRVAATGQSIQDAIKALKDALADLKPLTQAVQDGFKALPEAISKATTQVALETTKDRPDFSGLEKLIRELVAQVTTASQVLGPIAKKELDEFKHLMRSPRKRYDRFTPATLAVSGVGFAAFLFFLALLIVGR